MKFINVLAIDDEMPALRRLVSMVESHPNLSLAGTARSFAEAKEKIMQINADLLLLDIELKDATAFDLLSSIKDVFKGDIIFSTAFDKYALKAFDFHAIDYLLKPYSQERFNTAIERIVKKEQRTDLSQFIELLKKSENSTRTLIVPDGNKNYFLDSDKLYYIVAEGYYANFMLENEKKMIRISLKKLEELLPDNFIRINKSVIINKKFIAELIVHKVTSRIKMHDKNEFLVSAKTVEKLKLKFQ
ncbi:LytTR family DNA-binding domain-containing protein [Flavobacterium sp. CFS9]|uniref:LytTR family DNA-binding domain-containing protein n=1 Tax=Flavobacterium sp. CFS9 TaxID=3143118 RepID=A0AAT9H737_9FLAO